MEGTTALLWLVPEDGYVVALLSNREPFVQQLVPTLRTINETLLEPRAAGVTHGR